MTGLDTLLSPARVMCRAEAASKKRIFELASQRIADTEANLQQQDVYTQLLAREKIGSTGLGSGVAVPHCRVEGLAAPIGCLITLAEGVHFDSPDNNPVDLLFVLLVPPESTQEHLNLLAEIARRFSNPEYCRSLRRAVSDTMLLDTAVNSMAA